MPSKTTAAVARRGLAEKRGVSTASVSVLCLLLLALTCSLSAATAFADELQLRELIHEALRNNHEILLSNSRVVAARYRVPQAESLPDPTFTFGYTNEGFERYTLGEELGAQWVFGVSQMFPFPGKLALKGEMASREADRLSDTSESARLQTTGRVKELYYDLFFTYKSIDLILDKSVLFSRIEDAALARYASGTASQQEALTAQTEKYILLEKEEMLRQKLQSLEGALNAAVGRDIHAPLGRPAEPVPTRFPYDMGDSLKTSYANSPELKALEKTIAAAESKVSLNKKEYYPDFTLNAYYARRGGPFLDMWGLTASLNVPLYYRKKQRQAVLEAEESLSEARHQLEGAKLMIASSLRNNYAMLRAAERLMALYKEALIPKTHQDFELALSGYMTARVDAATTITRLKSLLDFETAYWGQFAEREKAIARIEVITGVDYTRSGGQHE
jgi:outer membrane protein TolC